MRIALISYAFAPQIGGIETVSMALAEGLSARGHDVTVVTNTRDLTPRTQTYNVLRKPSVPQLFKTLLKVDIVVQNNWSLRLSWPLYIFRKPVVNITQIWLSSRRQTAFIKKLLISWFNNITISRYMQLHLQPVKCSVFGNPYQETYFFNKNLHRKPNSLIFVGRLEPVKGADILLKAVQQLRNEGWKFDLTMIGGGPQLQILVSEAKLLEGQVNVCILGPKMPSEISEALNTHEIAVVPSVWEEPYGVVALEALACGCKLVVSDKGGLREAAGGYAEICQNGDVESLKAAILRASSQTINDEKRDGIDSHLKQRTTCAYAAYIDRILVGLRDESQQIT